jgi:hypothetical protein
MGSRAIFLSYSRQNQSTVQKLAADLEALGHRVWFDRELSGGQRWWESIIEQVRGCDAFVLAVSPQSLDSEACRRELAYARALGKPLLPVLLGEAVSTNLLPSALAEIQLVQYREAHHESALRLARAFTTLHVAPPVPEPAPVAPPAPRSYLGGLQDRLSGSDLLDGDTQSALLLGIKRALKDPADAADGRRLLEQLRRHPNLLYSVAIEIDEIDRPATPTDSRPAVAVAATRAAVDASPEPPPRAQRASMTRGRAAWISALAGWLVGVLGMLTAQRVGAGEVLGFALYPAIGAGLSGAITRLRWPLLKRSLLGGLVGWLMVVIVAAFTIEKNAIALAAIAGLPLGLFAGALTAAVFSKLGRLRD